MPLERRRRIAIRSRELLFAADDASSEGYPSLGVRLVDEMDVLRWPTAYFRDGCCQCLDFGLLSLSALNSPFQHPDEHGDHTLGWSASVFGISLERDDR